MKKIILASLLFAVIAAMGTADAEEKTVLRVSWWGGAERHEATLKAIEVFEKENPNISIKSEYMGWGGYLERMTTQIGSGSEPDAMQLNWAWLALFSKNGDGFVDLASLDDIVNTKAYEQKWLDTCMVKGKLNALPVSFTTRYFLWNKTIWERAGLSIPTTWEDIVNAGPVFQEKLGKDYYPLDVDKTSIVYMLASYIFQKTGKMIIDPETNQIGLDHDGLRDMFDYYKRLQDNHGITSLGHRSARSGDAEAQTYEQTDFIEGHWAGAFNWDSNLTLYLTTPRKEFQFVLGEFPTQEGAKNSGRIGRPSQILAVSKNSKHPREAAAFISFLATSPEAAKIQKMARGVFLADEAFKAQKAENLIAPLNLEALDQLVGQDVYSPNPFLEDPRMLNLLNDTLEQVSYEKITVDEAATALEREIPGILRRLNR